MTSPRDTSATQQKGAPPGRAKPRDDQSLLELAYRDLEELIVTCRLKPGSNLKIQDLQDITGYSRMPVYQAVTRLASDTLVTVRPRQGIQVAPVDLARAATLLRLRRDMERFVITLACDKASALQRTTLRKISDAMWAKRAQMPLSEFNRFDLQIDAQMLSICDEPFLEYSLRPLHTIFRRVGWIYHTHVPQGKDLSGTIDGHLRVLEAILSEDASAAAAASDSLMDFVQRDLDLIEREVDPAVLDIGQTLDIQ
ncbi:GntR family transcriptional regulator [Halomonas salipaludis]|uniref:Transcriptional regulator n=1 Tax=Halomonas salipaludis TaxID=2032625 RepID=A0A2A2F1R5_9GAMM|nr:GntR family transcriptional regulator [Halomonas salipaludis]PAU78587.1 transcriptional regulator [Halomonas salipaludis]